MVQLLISAQRPLALPRVSVSSRARRSVAVMAKDGRSGIHDPAGPTGSWGAGEANARKERLAQEESFRVSEQHLASEDLRAQQRSGGHMPGRAGVDRAAAVDGQLRELAEERSDEEYDNMPKVQKLFMEVKNALYSWLKTGVEPL